MNQSRWTALAGICLTLFLVVPFALGAQSALAQTTDPLKIGITPQEPAIIDVYRNANFQVNYRSAADPGSCDAADGDIQTWPAAGQTAMNHVVDIVDDLINSSVTIVIDACYQAAVAPDGGGGTVPDLDTLASAGPTAFFIQAEVPSLPVANREYAVALANAISGADQNGAEVEIFMSVNSRQDWDFCTVNCTVNGNFYDFVSTVVHEILHGLGFFTSFDPVDNGGNPPTQGMYSNPPSIMDDFVVQIADNSKLIDLPNNSATLWNAMQQGSGTIGFNGPNTLAINGNSRPFIYAPAPYSQGSSMSHWDDDHVSNLGRMMNSATGQGPSSRSVSAISLMTLKDLGWSVNEASDHGDQALNAYGDARHINAPGFVNHIRLGALFTSEAAAVANDASDDGVIHLGGWSIGATGGQVNVNMTGNQAGATGCISGWIDWTRDNDFDDAGEQIVAMRSVSIGDQNITFAIPNSIAADDSATIYNARFRLIPDWNRDATCADQVTMIPSGGLFGGEVEDFQWQLAGDAGGPPPATFKIYLPYLTK